MGIPFDTKELEAVGVLHMKTAVLQQDVKIYDFPVSKKEGFLAQYGKKPIWIPYGVEKQFVVPRMIPDNVARGAAGDIPLKPEEKGGPDMFGIEWEFIPAAGGSMVRPGAPLLNDISEWREKVKFPDIDSWDWEGSAKSWAKVHDPDKGHFFTLHNGFWFERLISFMGFENAVLAIFDEDTQDEVNALFEETTKLACRIVDKVVEYFDVDGFYVHDDWGTMKSSFFSPQVCAEMIVPHMRKFTDHIHAKGKLADLHSCGKIDNMVPNIIAAGWDSWAPMAICDTEAMFQKYGDQMVFAILPESFDPATTSEEEQREAARRFVETHCIPGKFFMFSVYGMPMLTPAFLEEMYIQSRKKYAELY